MNTGDTNQSKNRSHLLLEKVTDNTRINEVENKDVFLLFGDIKTGGIEDVYHVDGIGSGLANQRGIYFVGYAKVVETVGDLKSLYKFATGKELKNKLHIIDNQ